MMRSATKTVRTCVRPLGILAAAVLAMTAAGIPLTVSAEEPNEAAESDSRMSKLLDPVMAKAISFFKAGKYEEALAQCDAADRIFAKTKHSATPTVTGQKSMFSQLRSEIETAWGKSLMEPIRKDFDEAEKYLKGDPDTAKEKLRAVIAASDSASAKLPRLKAETETLKSAAEKYLHEGNLAADTAYQETIASREKFVQEKVDPLIKESSDLLADHLYKKAYAKCLEASKMLASAGYGTSPKVLAKKSEIIALRREITQKWERAYVMGSRRDYLKAVDMASKDIKEALSLARSAHARAVEGKAELPVVSDDLMAIEAACTKLIKSEEFQEASSLETIDVALERRRKDINNLLVKGEALYRNRMFSKARDVLEQVYVLDPFNEKANIILGKIYRKISDTAWMRRENEVLERIYEVEWKWVNPSKPSDENPAEEAPVEDRKTSETAAIYRKLQEIDFPATDFEDESAADVFSQIQRRSKELDPEKKGIPISYPAFKEDKFVTLKMGKLPMGELIRYVCMYTGLKYKISHLGVIIGEANLDDLSEQNFSMSNSLYDNITGTTTGETKNYLKDGVPDAPFGDAKNGGDNTSNDSANSDAAGSDALRNFFIDCGIPFGEGTTVSYNRRSRKLTVRNTPENLKTMSNLLERIDVETELVLVEAKIIEISVNDLEELGFDWTLTHNNQDPKWLYGDANSVDTASTFGNSDIYKIGTAVINQVLVRHTGGSGTGANFSTDDVSSALNVINNMNIIPNFGKDGAYNMFLTVHAVDQSSRGEVIAAPRVIAKSGKQAVIQMVQKMYFPDDWEEPELESNNNTFEYTPATPNMGDATPIGVNFTVTPTVGTNLRTITMNLAPSITALVGWTDYNYEVVVGNVSMGRGDGTNYSSNMKMPEIAERSIVTQLKVYDGDTVVLGGVLQETTMKRDDKYPFLGDIPLVGTLFSNRASNSSKRNLLIFVTPRLMGYNGVPVNAVTDNGRFDFNR